MGLNDDIDEDTIETPSPPVREVFGHVLADSTASAADIAEVDVTGETLDADGEQIPIAHTKLKVGMFQFTLQLEAEQARRVAHDLLAAVEVGGDDEA